MEVLYLFEIGDKVVYPMQGAGIIKNIEEKEFSGEKQEYYIIKMLKSNMEIMIPLDRISHSNLRLISDSSTLSSVLFSFQTKDSSNEEILPSKQRYQTNMQKLKSGSLKESAEVFYDLTLINKEKPLNSSEKQMLMNARKFLIDEMTLIKKISENEAEDLLDSSII
ncbi:transcription factor YdeB [Clostridium sp. MSJ-4]|uniref:Transcription factor YdeB n=1 Tax=Clostridium simiarum TaxID=2841506 RepID=A0ABS6EX19_9CLOT|nr:MULTISPECIES: CarD family transcriptional regulator [Clostridium]MBU5590199.1 transcription factor YdeB [Clostridium simiarum]